MSDTRTEHDFRIDPNHLRRQVDPADLPFEWTADVEPLVGTIGQPRALEAIDFGLEVPTAGYNLFLTGPPGSGRMSTVLDMLRRVAAERPAPYDWVYVHDFDRPDQPRGIRLPAGGARRLERDVDRIREDIPEHLPDFQGAASDGDHEQAPPAMQQAARREEHLDRYRINVLVDNDGATGAPIVLERNPTYYNLVGRVEYRSAMGAMVTDFRQVKAGALHRANGGFLVLEALELLRNPLAWEALKRALRQREVRIENLVEQFALLPTATIAPQAIALDVKVVLVGQPQLYQVLQQADEDFRDLFKVKADFAPDMDWTDENARGYAAFVSRSVREGGLRHFDRSALARLVEHGSRIREHQGKLSTRL